jgi:cytochrome c oxidase cbb3-type subunit 3
VRTLIEDGISPGMPPGWFLSDEEVANVANYVLSLGKVPPEKVPGDPNHGAATYARARCEMCHILAGEGNSVGPDLTDIGERRGADQIRLTLQHPDRTIPEEFLLVEAVPLTGSPIQGMRMNEDSFSIQIRDLAGRFHSFRKVDLKELKKLRGATPMPSYDRKLSAAELDDLVAYLAARRGQS